MDLVRSKELADSLIESHAFRINAELSRLRNDPDQTAAEIVDDIAYYTNLEISYVWAFTLWRLQAVFEAIIAQSFLPHSPKLRSGFGAKLSAIKAAGFALTPEDERALLHWSRVRNRLIHEPEWYYHEVWVQQEDIQEYMELVLRVLDQWKGKSEFQVYAPEVDEP